MQSNLFLDSGAHSLYTKHVIKKQHANEYEFYHTPEFWVYVDSYAHYVKENGADIPYYANIDVIFNPELSWEVLKYLEDKHGLNPVPVIHWGTPLEWLDRHLEAGYEYLGIGGLGQEVTKEQYFAWADRLFDRICPQSNGRLPIVRTHGFAMTAYELVIRYPWWSVDSASWLKSAAFGNIYVPRKRQGKYSFRVEPFAICVSDASPAAGKRGKHVHTIATRESDYVKEWLAKIGIPFGEVDSDGNELKWGVVSHWSARMLANLRFFDELANRLPAYPWPFNVMVKRGFLL